MPSSNNALVGALRVEATLDAGKFIDGARRIQKESKTTQATIKSSFSSMGASVKAGLAGFVGALTVGALVAAGKSALQYASHLTELAETLGVTSKDLQTFSYAAGQVGISQEELQAGLQKLTISMGKAQLGSEAQAKAFKALGISLNEIKGKDTGEVFRMIADKLQNVTDRSQRAAVEVALFGKAGAKLDNLLSGAEGKLGDLSAAAEKLGIVLSDEQIQKADRTADKIEALQTVLKAKIAGVVADNAESILSLAQAIGRLTAEIGHFLSSNPQLALGIIGALAGGRVGGLPGAAIGAVGGAILGGRVAQGLADNNMDLKFRMQQVRNAKKAFSDARIGASDPTGKLGANPAATKAAENELRRQTGLLVQATSAFTALHTKAPKVTGGDDIGQFLAPSGGGRKAKKGPTDKSDDALAQFAREQMQADQSILQAKRDLAGSAEQRALIDLQLIQLEHDMAAADIDENVRKAKKDFADGEITASALKQVEVQAEILKAKNDQKTAIEKQAFVEQQLARAEEAQFVAADQQRGFALQALQTADQLATTAQDHRRIQLQILDAEIEQKRLELEHEKQLAVRNGATADEIKVIQDKIDHLGAERDQGAANINQNTRNPLEDWAASIPKTKAEIIEAMQAIEVEGIDGLSDALTKVLTGTESLKSAFHQLAASILADLIQMTIKMLLFRAITAAFGGGGGIPGFSQGTQLPVDVGSSSLFSGTPGFALGGSFVVGGRSGTDKNYVSINGMPSFRVSNGERISVSNDNEGWGPPPVSLTMHNDFRGADPAAVAGIKAHLDQLEASLPTRIIGTMGDARDRFVWRPR